MVNGPNTRKPQPEELHELAVRAARQRNLQSRAAVIARTGRTPTTLRNSPTQSKQLDNHAARADPASEKDIRRASGRGRERGDGDRSPAVGVEGVADFEVDGPVGSLQQVARGLVHPRRRRQPRRRRARHQRVHHPPPPSSRRGARQGKGWLPPDSGAASRWGLGSGVVRGTAL